MTTTPAEQAHKIEPAFPPEARTLPSSPTTPSAAQIDISRESTAVAEPAPLSKKEKRDNAVRYGACHIALIVAGWADASAGPLIPYMQGHYEISYTVVSMIFIGQCAGYLVSGFINHFLQSRLGLGKVIVLGAFLQMLAYGLLIPAFPFPVFPVLYAISGIGVALQDAQANAYVAGLPKAEQMLSYIHASYGLGAAVCPLAATAFASSGILFARFYAVSLGLGVVNLLALLYAFRFNYWLDSSEAAAGESPSKVDAATASQPSSGKYDMEKADMPPDAQEGKAATLPARREGENGDVNSKWQHIKETALWQTLMNRATLFLCLFIFLYVGSEVAMGGWLVTFLMDNRGGGADAGYTVTGYWLGLVVGRVCLIPVTAWVGEQRVVYIYTGVALALEFAIWFRDDFIGNAVVASLIGVMMGPSYPIAVSVMTKLLPRQLHASAIAFLAAMGQVGAAIFPFITGAISNRFSPVALHPIMICLLAGQFISWLGVPKIPKRK
ncbi:hypothetical protein JCM6882_008683 [Rhodosporidiobolus microsporus]